MATCVPFPGVNFRKSSPWDDDQLNHEKIPIIRHRLLSCTVDVVEEAPLAQTRPHLLAFLEQGELSTEFGGAQ